MLGLADQVGRDDEWVRALVREHHHLGRTGDEIHAHLAEEDLLGGHHEPVTGTDQDIGAVPGEEAIRHRGERLHAAIAAARLNDPLQRSK